MGSSGIDTPAWYDELPLVDLERECEWKAIRVLGGLKAADVHKRGVGRVRDGKPACVMDDAHQYFALPHSLWATAVRIVSVPYSTDGKPATIKATMAKMMHEKRAQQAKDIANRNRVKEGSKPSTRKLAESKMPSTACDNNNIAGTSGSGSNNTANGDSRSPDNIASSNDNPNTAVALPQELCFWHGDGQDDANTGGDHNSSAESATGLNQGPCFW